MHENRQDFLLARHEFLSLCAKGMHNIHCDSGELWITFDACHDDVVLQAGESLALSDGRGILISALQTATLHITARPGARACLLNAGRSAWAAARRLRWQFPPLSSLPVTLLR